MTGYQIVGNEVRGPRGTEVLPDHAAACARGLKLHKADTKGSPLPPLPATMRMVDLEWSGAKPARHTGAWAATWNGTHATVLSEAGIQPLSRADLELSYERVDGEKLGDGGTAQVRKLGDLEALRVDGPVLSEGRISTGPGYAVRGSGVAEKFYTNQEFGVFFELLASPKKGKGS